MSKKKYRCLINYLLLYSLSIYYFNYNTRSINYFCTIDMHISISIKMYIISKLINTKLNRTR